MKVISTKLRTEGVDLEQENNTAGFLGIKMVLDVNTGLLEMKQEGLINQFIKAMGLDAGTVNPKWTPAESSPLVKDSEGAPTTKLFSYGSVVGMLLYLSRHFRPDISFAIHQCARYTFAPTKKHKTALIRIDRYLKGTLDKSLVTLTPTEALTLDC